MQNHDCLIMENVRCFTHPKPVPLAPLTILIGENSTGKSTFLAMCRFAWDLAFNPSPPDFNEEPFFLGSFDQIANFRGGKGGRAKQFQIGWQTRVWYPVLTQESRKNEFHREEMKVNYCTKFAQAGSQPIIVERSLSFGDYSIVARFNTDSSFSSIELSGKNHRRTLTRSDLDAFPAHSRLGSAFSWEMMYYVISTVRYGGKQEKTSLEKKQDNNLLSSIAGSLVHIVSGRPDVKLRPYASAPVRTKPERTYNPIDSLPKAEGSHVPMVLAKIFQEDKHKWDQLKDVLDKFGSSSGLFNSLDVRPLGKEGDPFQVSVKIGGPARNLIDVGYGVSQALPIVVDVISGLNGRTFLFQQPEVHLHPRGQAELGTFLAKFAKVHQKRFVVETHSDYLLDRIRMDLRDKTGDETLDHNDVMILFFERLDSNIEIHEIRLDSKGDFVSVPAGYRRFFLEEERRHLGF